MLGIVSRFASPAHCRLPIANRAIHSAIGDCSLRIDECGNAALLHCSNPNNPMVHCAITK
jgi:hypothetical protein